MPRTWSRDELSFMKSMILKSLRMVLHSPPVHTYGEQILMTEHPTGQTSYLRP